MLEINNLNFHYEKQEQDYLYNFKLEAGEIIAITGVSGSGKSTLLDLIAGFLTPTSGNILFNNKDITNLTPQERPISILFQENNLFDHLSVNKNLELVTKNKQAINNALKDVGLESFTNQKASKLSGGQKQRVALARTLLRNRPILLLDEPFASLDEETTVKMRNLLRKLIKQYVWHTIIVTHNKDDALALGAEIYAMKNGVLQLEQ